MKSESTSIVDLPSTKSLQGTEGSQLSQSQDIETTELENKCLQTQSLRVDFPDGDLARRLQCHISTFVSNDHLKLPSGSPLDISVHDGRVVISGEVESLRDRDFLLNCCRRVAGVIQLDDRELRAIN